MTAAEFTTFWNANYHETIPLQHHFKHDYPKRWLRIHSLPQSKRYAETTDEWKVLLHRQNNVATELLGNGSKIVIVTGEYQLKAAIEMHTLDDAESIKHYAFSELPSLSLHTISPDEFEEGDVYKPRFTVETWSPHKFNDILRDIANDDLRAFFISIENKNIVAPYDGGIDIIVKDEAEQNGYKLKYKDWLSLRVDGL